MKRLLRRVGYSWGDVTLQGLKDMVWLYASGEKYWEGTLFEVAPIFFQKVPRWPSYPDKWGEWAT